MFIQNPKMQTMKEIRKDFNGYCVCIADRQTNERDWTLAGKVIVYDKWMKDVWEQAETLTDDILSENWDLTDLTNFDGITGSGIVEVISLEKD